MRRRDLRIGPRDAMTTEVLSHVSVDDVMHAHETARLVCTAQYNRYLGAGLDTSARVPRGDG
jgi:hypothetical protein